MKNKKIFKTILLIAIILLAVGCGLASCKKTKAHDQMTITSGLDSPNRYQGILLGFSLDLGDLYGNQITANQGDDFYDIMNELGYTLDNTNTYLFVDSATNYPILGINFYYGLSLSGQPETVNVQFYSFEENQVMYSIKQTYTYNTSYDKFLIVYWRPFTDRVEYQLFSYSNMQYETQPLVFNTEGTLQYVPIYDESYQGQGYEESQSPENMYFVYSRSNLHSNDIMYISNVDPAYTFSYWINIYNNGLTYRYNYYNDMRIKAYRNGYSSGYTDGGDAEVSESYQLGLQEGQRIGYNEGYDAGARGDNAVSSFINILTSIFTGIGAIFSIQLFPHITIGLFLLVPLFFGVLGLILWIWRHN